MLFGIIALAGCASVSVKTEKWSTARPELPPRIFVDTFKLPADALRVDRKGNQLEEFTAETQKAFSADLAERLSKAVGPTEVLSEASRPRTGDWIVSGEFIRVNQGSRALRSLVGWGLGGTKMEVVTRIDQVDRRKKKQSLAEIGTTGGSNAEPGAIFAGPFTAVPRLILAASLTGITVDRRRTARMVTASISEKLTELGYELPSKPQRAKRLGSLPLQKKANPLQQAPERAKTEN